VDAPEGRAATPTTPDSRTTSASIVGFPLESRISLPVTWIILISKYELMFYVEALFSSGANLQNSLRIINGIVKD
jgi:hypothetical protein